MSNTRYDNRSLNDVTLMANGKKITVVESDIKTILREIQEIKETFKNHEIEDNETTVGS